MTSAEALEGNRMTEEGIDDLLEAVGFGVLSMSLDGVPYGLPLSFGCDGDDRLYFVFVGHSDAGRKTEYVEHTDRVSFLAYDVAEPGTGGASSSRGRSTGSPSTTGRPRGRNSGTTGGGRSCSPTSTRTRTRASGRSRSSRRPDGRSNRSETVGCTA